MTTTLATLRQVVIDEAKKFARLGYATYAASEDLCLAVRALERHEQRIAELEARMEEEAAK